MVSSLQQSCRVGTIINFHFIEVELRHLNKRLDNFPAWLESDRIVIKTQLIPVPVLFMSVLCCILGLPWWLSGKESAFTAGDPGLVPGLGRFARVENGYPLQYPCLKNPMFRGAWQAAVNGAAKSQTQRGE